MPEDHHICVDEMLCLLNIVVNRPPSVGLAVVEDDDCISDWVRPLNHRLLEKFRKRVKN